SNVFRSAGLTTSRVMGRPVRIERILPGSTSNTQLPLPLLHQFLTRDTSAVFGEILPLTRPFFSRAEVASQASPRVRYWVPAPPSSCTRKLECHSPEAKEHEKNWYERERCRAANAEE